MASLGSTKTLWNILAHPTRVVLLLTNFTSPCRLARLFPGPSTLPPSRFVRTHLRPRPLPPRFPPSLSRESVVFRRKLALLRLDVSFPSGTSPLPCFKKKNFERAISTPIGRFDLSSTLTNIGSTVTVLPVSMAWPMSRLRNWSSM